MSSPDERYDSLFIHNYITLRIKDELSRQKGVGDVNVFGAEDYSMRVWLDPNRLKAAKTVMRASWVKWSDARPSWHWFISGSL